MFHSERLEAQTLLRCIYVYMNTIHLCIIKIHVYIYTMHVLLVYIYKLVLWYSIKIYVYIRIYGERNILYSSHMYVHVYIYIYIYMYMFVGKVALFFDCTCDHIYVYICT